MLPPPLSPDRALLDPEEDRLGYAPFAKQLAHSILRGSPADGLVVALYGAWGTGKSTALNFVLHYVESDADADPAVVVRFNPWWFAGREDLVRRFFGQFEAALFKAKARKRSLLKKLSAFSSLVSDLPIPYAGATGKAAKAAIAAVQTADVVELKADLVAALAKSAIRVIVVIDDIDRLAGDEIQQLFQVVKAVADFPNVIYLMAFDRAVVVSALGRASGVDGDEYLEKIVQVPFTLPPPDRMQLQALFFERLGRLLDGTPDELFDQQHWGNLYLDGIDPLISKPRDVVRLINALGVTYGAVRGEVNAADFIAIEALRIFLPKAYETIRTNAHLFAGGDGDFGDRKAKQEAEKSFHEAWLSDLAEDRPVAQKLVSRLFPRLSSVWGNTTHGHASLVEWRKRLRVCSPEVFPTFFRFAVPEGEVSSAVVRGILAEAPDASVLAERLLALLRERRADGHTRASSLLTRLNDHADKDIPDVAVPNLIRALFDVGDELVRGGQRTTSPFDLGDDYRVGWLVHSLVKRIPKDTRVSVLEQAFLSGRGLVTMVRELVYFSGQHGNWGRDGVPEDERLLPVEGLAVLEQLLLSRVRVAHQDKSLWTAVHPTNLLEVWAVWGDQDEMKTAVTDHLQEDAALVNFLGHFITRVRRRALTDQVGRTTLKFDLPQLAGFVDVKLVAQRLHGLSDRGLTDDDRSVLAAFSREMAQSHASDDEDSTVEEEPLG